MKKNVFIVKTENFLTKKIAMTALKAVDTNDITHSLLRKACMNGGKLVIADVTELRAWRDALENYKPASKSEGKILRVLKSAATRGIANRTATAANEN